MKCNKFIDKYCTFDDNLDFLRPDQTTPDDETDKISKLYEHSADCNYYLPDHSIFPSRPPNSLFILHLNIRSLTKNFESVYEFLQPLSHPPEVICISETWIRLHPITNITILFFTFSRIFSLSL